MTRGLGSSDTGHERAHDPCRADWQEVTAVPAEPTRTPWLVPGLVLTLLAVVAVWAATVL
jgi:hypothetical protein